MSPGAEERIFPQHSVSQFWFSKRWMTCQLFPEIILYYISTDGIGENFIYDKKETSNT